MSPEGTFVFFNSLRLTELDSFFLDSSISVIFPFSGVVLISLIGLEDGFYRRGSPLAYCLFGS